MSGELLPAIKKLAVTSLHPSVHVVALHQLRQDSSESTKAYSARVKGLAKNCNLVKTCTRDGCSEKVSSVQETCDHVVMAGLASEELKEKVLTQPMLGVVTKKNID